jgi:hypothetical protein
METGTPTVTYPPDLRHKLSVLTTAYRLCAGSGDRALQLSLLIQIHQTEDGY